MISDVFSKYANSLSGLYEVVLTVHRERDVFLGSGTTVYRIEVLKKYKSNGENTFNIRGYIAEFVHPQEPMLAAEVGEIDFPSLAKSWTEIAISRHPEGSEGWSSAEEALDAALHELSYIPEHPDA